MNDIERQSFWGKEMDEFLVREEKKKIEKVMRWDSITNKVPINERKVTEIFHHDIPDYLHH